MYVYQQTSCRIELSICMSYLNIPILFNGISLHHWMCGGILNPQALLVRMNTAGQSFVLTICFALQWCQRSPHLQRTPFWNQRKKRYIAASAKCLTNRFEVNNSQTVCWNVYLQKIHLFNRCLHVFYKCLSDVYRNNKHLFNIIETSQMSASKVICQTFGKSGCVR